MTTPDFILKLREKAGHDLLWLVGGPPACWTHSSKTSQAEFMCYNLTFAAKEGRSPTLSWENGPLSCDFFRRGTP